MTVERSNGSPFGKAVCAMLGVDPTLVQCLTITVQAGDIIRVSLEMIPSFKRAAEVDAAIELLKEADKELTARRASLILDCSSIGEEYKVQEFVPNAHA